MTKELLPVRKELLLNCPIDHAFAVFVDRISDWWPFRDHSCFEEDAEKIAFEKKVGGKVIEISKSGETAEWGKLLTWNPPNDFSMTWHPGGTIESSTELSVSFKAVSPEKTELLLVHAGWEKRGDKAPVIRKNYETGWDVVLELYTQQSQENL